MDQVNTPSCSSLRPELDFFSTSFNPVWTLNTLLELPFPQAKTYNNLAEYYSHTFLKKDPSKKVEKDRPYDRDFSFYYATLGMDENAQRRYEERKMRRNAYKMKTLTGFRRAKMRKYFVDADDPNREPCRSYPPLQSTKIVQIETPFSKYKLIPKTNLTEKTGDKRKVSNTTVKGQCSDTLESALNTGNFELVDQIQTIE